jgi:hypothetical protein
MMNDDDDFAQNPFRTGGTNSNNSQRQDHHDLLSVQNPGPPPPDPFSPDPNSGMIGSLQPLYSDQQQQHQHQPNLSGPMDSAQQPKPKQDHQVFSTPFGPLNRCLACFRLDGYQPYFDLDTADIVGRLRASVTQFHCPDLFRNTIVGGPASAVDPSADPAASSTTPTTGKGPDLYGPVWLCMTLIFLVAVTSNLSKYMHYHKNQQHSSTDSTTNNNTEIQEFEYDIRCLLRAGTTLGVFCWGLPTALWLSSQCLGVSDVAWAMWICVYGYAMTPYLVASLAQEAATSAKATPILFSMLGAHFLLLIVLKVVFYSG